MTCDKDENNCYNLTVAGTSGSPISSIQWQVRANGSSVWANLTTGMTAQICNQTEVFFVQVIVTFDPVDGVQCPPITLGPKRIDPCVDIIPNIQCTTYLDSMGQTCVFAEIPTLFPHTIDLFTYDLGAGPIPYVSGDPICGLTDDITFNATINFTDDDCDPIELDELVCPIPPLDPDCGMSTAIPECIEDANGCKTFGYTGTFPIEPAKIEYWYRCDPSEEFRQWDGVTPICCDCVEVYLYAPFCDNICKPYCSPTIECGCLDCPTCGGDITCTNCIASVPDCPGFTWEWFNLNDQTDPNVQPNLTVAQIQTYTSMGNATTVTLPDNVDQWYVAIGTHPDCVDPTIKYFYHDAPQTGTGGSTTIIR